MIAQGSVWGVGAWALLLAAGCGSSTSNGPSLNGGSGGSLNTSGGKSSQGGQSFGGSASGDGIGGQGDAGEQTGGNGQGGQAQPQATRILVLAGEEETDSSSSGLWSFNVDGSNGVDLYGLTFNYSLPKKRDRVLINGAGTVVLIDLDGNNRRDIACPGALQARISPSGKYYAYPDVAGENTYQLFVAGTDGSPAKPVFTLTGQIIWTWDPDSDVLIYNAGSSIEFYDWESAESSSVSAFGNLLGLPISPDSSKILYTVREENKRFLRVWNRKTGTGVTAYEGIDPGTYQHWATDSSAFTLPTFASQDVPAGVLAAQVTGENATFVPGAEGAFGFTSPNTFLVRTASGALEAWKLGATQGVELLPNAFDVALGEGFAAQCEQASGVITLVNDDGSNRHAIDGTFECQAGMVRSGRYLAAVTKGFAGLLVFHDTTTPPEALPSLGAPLSLPGSLRGGEGFTVNTPDKASWIYRTEQGFIMATPSRPLFGVRSGLLLP